MIMVNNAHYKHAFKGKLHVDKYIYSNKDFPSKNLF